jgi:acetyl esterase/lipase
MLRSFRQKLKRLRISAILILTGGFSLLAQPPVRVLYKQIDTTSLFLEVYTPGGLDPDSACPAMVFFFGGGWNGGSISQFEPHARYFSERGMVCFLAEYRVRERNGTAPYESLKDARSALRFVRKNAGDFHVDTSRIVASGGSAGGHLAAATALVKGFDDESDDLTISCLPDALVLFNPVIDNGPGGYGYDRVESRYKDFSPLHNINKGAPPTIFFLGTEDRLVPVETAMYYKIVMEKVGSRCDLHLYDGAGHGFFNYRNPENYRKTVLEADRFLLSLGYLSGEPAISLNAEGGEGN